LAPECAGFGAYRIARSLNIRGARIVGCQVRRTS
jgi:hypothetical protein